MSANLFLLEIHVHSKQNVINGLRDCLDTIYAFINCLGFQKFSFFSRSYFEPTVMFVRRELPVKPDFGRL